ncbi:flavin monoamine oxidase family protein [Burkholderia vietnamiensis]|uniref:flavin monoamine oxidase family protein n=1 Tax=Burkholderia vietnamiensis TaxID=60552 RepID=UPI001B9CCAF2|nr:NAD(P)/FAD-dependent oxidoreductase [Burkholderia vietnamiensis]MBR8279701.1 FAD-dependent oxidoreductase [Burkholderia vietnamiensis]
MNAPEFLSRTLPYIDTLYDYGAFLARTGGHLGTLPADGARDARIAIVGAGVGGLVAACELLRAGARQLVVFEANPARVGGRLLSQSINPDHPHLLAEMGAMRFPPSQAALYHYLERFGIDSSSTFPDPGVVDTEIHYQGHAYRWPAGERPPALFDRVDRGWRAFIRDGVRLDDGTQLPAPAELTALLRAHCYDDARRGWQQYIDRFGDESFYSAIVKIFTGATPPGGVRWRRSEDLRLFGTLGIGSGGFQPVYRASFLEILRIVVNELEVDQRLIPAGIFALAQRLLDDGGQAARVRDRVVHAAVRRVEKQPDGTFALTLDDGTTQVFDRVIVATTTRAMQVGMGITGIANLFAPEVVRAINDTHMVSSSKLFVLTRDKFWLKHGLPHNIQTDTLARGIYCLDYAPDDCDAHGVVLISYTWEDDSHKILSLTDKVERFQRLVAEIGVVSPAFAAHLRPLDDDYARNVTSHDWLSDRYALGAFKLNYPGEDIHSQALFYQFQTAAEPSTDRGIYLAGCCCSFTGGWIEGAVQTAINAASAVIHSLGSVLADGNPLDAMRNRYRYGD